MIRISFLRSLLTATFISVSFFVQAQTELPDITITRKNGVNILSWFCQYDGIKSIAVQRSSDSIYNYTTIGYVKNLKKGNQAFIDGHPRPGDNWYKLYIVFSSDLTWHSNMVKLHVDSTQLMEQQTILPPNDSLQQIINSLAPNETPRPSQIKPYSYTRSQYVFTNPFTGHINVELPDRMDKHVTYSLQFFDRQEKRILDIPRVSQQSVILDKRNFQRKGIYRFELRKNKQVLESGYITVY